MNQGSKHRHSVIGKITAVLLALVMLCGVCFVGDVSAAGENDTTQSPTISKTATKNQDGSYTLDLTVSGMVGSETNPALVDIVIVIDKSKSMEGDRLSSAKTAATNLVDALDQNSGIDAQYNIVTFSGTRRTEDKEVDSTTIMNSDSNSSGWTNAATAKSTIENISVSGSTNYEAGLLQAKEQLNKARLGTTTIVVFLTDGEPTLRCSNKQKETVYNYYNYYYGDGSYDNNSYNINAAKTAVATITMNRFYVIGTGDAKTETLNALANAAALAGTTSVRSTTEGTGLTSIFNDIAADITTFLCNNVTVTDTLSKNDADQLMVQPAADAVAKVTVLKSDGTVVAGPDASVNLEKTSKNAAATITATYNSDTGTLMLNFPTDYQLEPDYIYKLTIDIEPTEAAYAEYRANNLTYLDTADANTGTHAGGSGFYCNGDATLTYSYKGTVGSMEYPKPVVQLNPGKLIVTKTIAGLEGDTLTALQNALTFTVFFDYPEPTETETKTLRLSDFTENNGVYNYEINGLSPNTVCTVTESNQNVSGYTVTTTMTGIDSGSTDQVTVPKGETKTLSITNDYAVATINLIVEKQVTGVLGDVDKEFNFTYSYTKDDGTPVTGNFNLKDSGTTIIQNVPIGAKLTLTETNAKGYVTTAVINNDSEDATENDVYVTNGANKEQSEKSMEISVTEDLKSITITNNKDVVPDTGFYIDSAPFILILALVILGATAFIVSRRRKDLI